MNIAEFLADRYAEEDQFGHAAGTGLLAERLLRHVRAGRVILAEHGQCHEPGDSEFPCPVVRALAAVYDDHPDYRQPWQS